MNLNVFPERLRTAMRNAAFTTDRLAEHVGVSASGIKKWLAGSSEPGLTNLVATAEALNITVEWLATGNDSRLNAGMIQSDTILSITQKRAPSDIAPLVQLPLLDVSASAGAGAVVETERVDRMIAFDPDWLRRHKITPSKAEVLTARGDSMEPTIRTGDLLIIDRSVTVPVDNGIYVVNYDGVLLVKRIFLLSRGRLMLSSDNKLAGVNEEIGPNEMDAVRVIGRVMWFGREI